MTLKSAPKSALKSDMQAVPTLDRRGFLKTSTLLATTGLALSAMPSARAQSEPGIEGAVAPELELDYWIDADGKSTDFSIQDAQGKWTLLKCWQNWCPGCHKYGFPTLKAFSDRFQGNPKVAIAGIQTVFEGYSSNTQDAVREIQMRYELPIVMGHDPGDEKSHSAPSTMRNYRTGGTPWLILINPDGVVVFNHFHVDTEKLISYVDSQIA